MISINNPVEAWPGTRDVTGHGAAENPLLKPRPGCDTWVASVSGEAHMAPEFVSRQALIRRRRSSRFVGRRRELAVFRENFSRNPGSDEYQFVFHVHGRAGVGKSTLIRRWETLAQERGAITAIVGEEAQSVIEAMETVSARLARQDCPLKSFDKQLAVYRQKCHEIEAVTAALMPGEDGGAAQHVSAASTVAAHIGAADRR
ncbi:ATP-binding protein [Streptomyces sp. TLI_146]|uniref:ATP-binding protein n=1 Tax=Streptomyces sp. TLI_146 TaxID=1938858 RepID=UPI00117BFD4B|nr:ATP-binding protein [Streptomyces sp. TLI_146]